MLKDCEEHLESMVQWRIAKPPDLCSVAAKTKARNCHFARSNFAYFSELASWRPFQFVEPDLFQ